MNKYDQLVKDFLKDKWLKRWGDFVPNQSPRYGESDTTRNIRFHLAGCETIEVKPLDIGWDCGCWSEYTREDAFEFQVAVTCGCGCHYYLVDRFDGDLWDPQEGSLIRQLEEYESTWNCIHSEDGEGPDF